MKATTKSKLLSLIGFLCFAIPSYIYLLWIQAFSLGTDQTERVSVFKSYFPEFLNGRWDITVLSILFCTTAAVTSGIAVINSSTLWKLFNSLILLLSGLLLFLNVFSIM